MSCRVSVTFVLPVTWKWGVNEVDATWLQVGRMRLNSVHDSGSTNAKLKAIEPVLFVEEDGANWRPLQMETYSAFSMPANSRASKTGRPLSAAASRIYTQR